MAENSGFVSILEGIIPGNGNGVRVKDAFFSLSALFDAGLNAPAAASALDSLIHGIGVKLSHGPSPVQKTEAINDTVFFERGFTVDRNYDIFLSGGRPPGITPDVKDAVSRLSAGFITGSKKGVFLSLAAVYMSIAEELKIPLFVVASESRDFIRYNDGKVRYDAVLSMEGRIMNSEPAGNGAFYGKEMGAAGFIARYLCAMARIFLAMDRREEAGACLAKSEVILPENPALAIIRDGVKMPGEKPAGPQASVKKEESQGAGRSGEGPEALGELCVRKYNDGDYAGALECFSLIPEKSKERIRSLFMAGMAAYKLNDLAAAEQYMRKSVEAGERVSDSKLQIAKIYAVQKKHKEARAVLEDILGADPGNAHANYALGIMLSAMNENEKAEECLKKALESDKNDPHTMFALASLYAAQGRTKEAHPLALKLMESDPPHPGAAGLLEKMKSAGKAPAPEAPPAEGLELLFKEACGLFETGKKEEAEKKFAAILEKDPGHAGAGSYMGLIEYQKGNEGRGFELIHKAIKDHPESEDARFCLSKIYMIKEVYGQAEDELRAAVKLGEKRADIWAALGECLFMQEKVEESLAAFRKSLTMAPENARVYAKYSQLLEKKGDTHGAEAALKKARELAPGSFEVQLAAAKIYMAKSQPEKAAEACRAAAEADKKSAEPLLMLGQIYSAAGKYGETVTYLVKASELSPSDAKISHALAAAYVKTNMPQQAEAIYKKIIESAPEDLRAHNGLCGIYMNAKDYAAAIEQYQKLVAAHPNDLDLRYGMVKACFEARRTDLAEEQLKKAAALDPQNAETQAELALTAFRLVKYDEAESAMKRALALKPNDAKYHFIMGNIYRDQIKFKEAEEHYKKAVSINNSYAEAHCHMGYLLWEEGKFKDAEKYFKKAVELKPELNVEIEEKKNK